MPEDDGRMICDNPTSYQLLKAKHGLKRATPHIKNFFSVLLEHPTNFVVGIGIILRFIFTAAIFNVLRIVFYFVTSILFMPTMWAKDDEQTLAGHRNETHEFCIVAGALVLTFSFLGCVGFVVSHEISLMPFYAKTAFLALLATNALSGISELGRYARNKKAASASPVSVLAPLAPAVVADSTPAAPVTSTVAPSSAKAATDTDAHVIDCDTTPHVPINWSLEEHLQGGRISWDAKSIVLYLDEQQKTGRVPGSDLREKFKGMPVLNANVLDYLLAHPHLIPEEWRGKYIYFWGTIYRYSDRSLYVRYLYWLGDRWDWYFDWLGFDWDSFDPAAVCASLPAAGR